MIFAVIIRAANRPLQRWQGCNKTRSVPRSACSEVLKTVQSCYHQPYCNVVLLTLLLSFLGLANLPLDLSVFEILHPWSHYLACIFPKTEITTSHACYLVLSAFLHYEPTCFWGWQVHYYVKPICTFSTCSIYSRPCVFETYRGYKAHQQQCHESYCMCQRCVLQLSWLVNISRRYNDTVTISSVITPYCLLWKKGEEQEAAFIMVLLHWHCFWCQAFWDWRMHTLLRALVYFILDKRWIERKGGYKYFILFRYCRWVSK